MKNFVFAFAIAASTLVASNVEAMNLGSLSRQHPVVQKTELASLAYPAVCADLSCGTGTRTAADISPILHIVFASIGSFLRSHADLAAANGRAAGLQFISVASAN